MVRVLVFVIVPLFSKLPCMLLCSRPATMAVAEDLDISHFTDEINYIRLKDHVTIRHIYANNVLDERFDFFGRVSIIPGTGGDMTI